MKNKDLNQILSLPVSTQFNISDKFPEVTLIWVEDQRSNKVTVYKNNTRSEIETQNILTEEN